jgi:hypothetical protein
MPTTGSKSEILTFAKWFCEDRVETFEKDMRICMTPDEKGRHAYMPSVIGCASFLELFAGLHAGSVDPVGIKNILSFANKYLDTSEFKEESVCIFFEMFRHKVAHVTRPYSVFDSHAVKPNSPLKNYPQRRLTWRVTASFQKPSIQIIQRSGKIKNSRRPPWKLASYSHICKINLKRMIRELPKAIIGPTGYLDSLAIDSDIRKKFVKCMDSFYP